MEGEQQDSKTIKKILNSYKSRMAYNELPLRVILYKCNCLYEYNPYDNEIRPFNSFVWYKLDEFNGVSNFLSYIKNHYLDIIKDNTIESDLGIISGGMISISLEHMKDDIIPREINISKKEKDLLEYSFDIFMSHVSELYDLNRELLYELFSNVD